MPSSHKREVFDQLIDEVRRSQLATERFDQAVADALGLNRTDMRCLDVIERAGPVTAGRLARETGLTTGAMTTALDRLERAGYARRVRDGEDRRRVLVELAPGVRERSAGFYAPHIAAAERIFERYTTDQLELLRDFVRAGRLLNDEQATLLEQRGAKRAGSQAAGVGRAD
jgi:DNA-binding MarR family transcriptional regulator